MKNRLFRRNPGLETADGDVVTLDEVCGVPEVPSIDPVLAELLLESEELLNLLSVSDDHRLHGDAAKLSGRIGRTLESMGA